MNKDALNALGGLAVIFAVGYFTLPDLYSNPEAQAAVEDTAEGCPKFKYETLSAVEESSLPGTCFLYTVEDGVVSKTASPATQAVCKQTAEKADAAIWSRGQLLIESSGDQSAQFLLLDGEKTALGCKERKCPQPCLKGPCTCALGPCY